MSKSNLRYQNLREAMEEVQKERSLEVGGHTWETMVERYGEAVLMAEIFSIIGRLEQLVWHVNPYENYDAPSRIDRMLDLLIDLGNYTEFLYLATMARAERGQKFSRVEPTPAEEPS